MRQSEAYYIAEKIKLLYISQKSEDRSLVNAQLRFLVFDPLTHRNIYLLEFSYKY